MKDHPEEDSSGDPLHIQFKSSFKNDRLETKFTLHQSSLLSLCFIGQG